MGFNSNRSTELSCSTLKQQVLTIASNRAVGGDNDCRIAYVMAQPTKTVYIGASASMDTDSPLLPADVYTELKVSNTNLLHFYGTDGDKVYILSME